MNVIVANNHNYIRGGAEKVFFDEYNLLKNNGINVKKLSFNDNNSIKYHQYEEDQIDDFNTNIMSQFKNIFWNKKASNKLEEILKRNNYDLFHGQKSLI
jgi:hypothetical protein